MGGFTVSSLSFGGFGISGSLGRRFSLLESCCTFSDPSRRRFCGKPTALIKVPFPGIGGVNLSLG